MIKKSVMRVYALVLTAMIALLSSFTGISAFALNNEVRNGTVAVVFHLGTVREARTSDGETFETVDTYSEGDWSGGSGFFVGKDGEDPQYIVTNCHVVEDFVNAKEGEEYVIDSGILDDGYLHVLYAESCEMRIYYSEDDYDEAYVDCYGDSDKVDLAVLRLKNPTSKRHSLPLKPVSDDMVGTQIYTVGFPGNADNLFTNASQYAAEDATVSDGIIEKIAVNEGKGVERIQVSAKIHHGNSGGPLVDDEGNVLGVNTNVWSNSPFSGQIEADYYSISSNEIIRFLDKNNIPYTPAGSSKLGGASGKGGKTTLIAIGAAAAAAIVAGVAVFAVKSKKPAAAGAGAGAVPASAPVNAAPKGVIRSLSPALGNKAFAIGAIPIVIGRDPKSCGIVFDAKTNGVSGKHCSVAFDPVSGLFTLTDLGSTYGTFLSNGQKLAPNTPVTLKSGISFYAGDKANMFKVEISQ